MMSAHLLVLCSQIPCAIGDLGASVLNDFPADWNIGYSVLPAVGVGWLEEGEHTGGCRERGGEESAHLIFFD